MEVYVDEMLTKRRKVDDHICGLAQAFNVMEKYKIKLNLAKCVFDFRDENF